MKGCCGVNVMVLLGVAFLCRDTTRWERFTSAMVWAMYRPQISSEKKNKGLGDSVW